MHGTILYGTRDIRFEEVPEPPPLQNFNGLLLGIGHNRLAGSIIGGIAERQEVIDYCT